MGAFFLPDQAYSLSISMMLVIPEEETSLYLESRLDGNNLLKTYKVDGYHSGNRLDIQIKTKPPTAGYFNSHQV
ncbi:hypothetical protein PITCH_A2030028 [uncultured Desulfobacterium sp.]|uniref:Uncharacterized protein n=1 Tax=uncultured Desulfobacterium sp. TaxID=201089 RepID=A0A445MWH0_9BACT|nr:hypothetical protein PITCH_A2030028 [uncultured Desulfobacterium sp.]